MYKCSIGNTADTGAAHAWDEGWAFYAGSLQSYGATNGCARRARRSPFDAPF